MVGDGERYLSALLTMRVQVSRTTGLVTNDLAPDVLLYLVTKLESKSQTVDDIRSDKKVLDYINDCIEKANKKSVSRVSQVKRWVIIDNDFSFETSELTPTGKVKRNVVYKKHSTKISEMYQLPKL